MSTNRFPSLSALFIFMLLTATNAFSPLHLLHARQQNNTAICMEYSTTANLSIVGANATYRSAYLAASPQGGDPARAPLDSAVTQLPKFQFDQQINDECGNLTIVAMQGAETNFTQGIVLQFQINAGARLGAGALGMVTLGALVALMVGSDLL